MFRITHLINELRSCFQCCLLLLRVGSLAFNENREKRGQLLKSSAYPEKKLSQVLLPFATVEGPSLPARWCQMTTVWSLLWWLREHNCFSTYQINFFFFFLVPWTFSLILYTKDPVPQHLTFQVRVLFWNCFPNFDCYPNLPWKAPLPPSVCSPTRLERNRDW